MVNILKTAKKCLNKCSKHSKCYCLQLDSVIFIVVSRYLQCTINIIIKFIIRPTADSVQCTLGLVHVFGQSLIIKFLESALT